MENANTEARLQQETQRILNTGLATFGIQLPQAGKSATPPAACATW